MGDEKTQEHESKNENQAQGQNRDTQVPSKNEADVMDKASEQHFNQVTPSPNPLQGEQGEKKEEGEQKPKKPENQEFVFDGKKFSSMEQVERYIKLLEEQNSNQKKNEDALKNTVEYQMRPPEEKKEIDRALIDKMYDDPESFVTELEQKLYSKIEKKETVKKNQEQFWNAFYGENPELKNKERAVQMVMSEQWDKLKGLTTDEAQKFLSKEVKHFIYETTGQKVESEVESKGGAVYTGSGGHSRGVSGDGEGNKRTTFFEELKQLRKKRA